MGAGAAVCCCALRDPHVGRSYAIAKWAYCGLFTVITIVTWVLRDYSDEVRSLAGGGVAFGGGVCEDMSC
jgi:hypothetical protein